MQFFSYFSSLGFSNCYIIGPDGGGDAIIIDPGIFDLNLLGLIEENHLNIKYILVTHNHDDHINGIHTIRKIYNTTIYSFRQTVLEYPSIKLKDKQKIKLGEFEFTSFETPGHSGDSLTFKLNDMLFTGDCILAGSPGYTVDAFSKTILLNSLKDRIFSQDDETYIFPGHGPPSKVGIEKILNPELIE